MKKLLCLLLGTSLVLSSCGGAWSKGPENLDEQDDFKTVRIDKEYQLRLPKYLEKRVQPVSNISLISILIWLFINCKIFLKLSNELFFKSRS